MKDKIINDVRPPMGDEYVDIDYEILEAMKSEYNDIEIPDELESVVRNAIKISSKGRLKSRNTKRKTEENKMKKTAKIAIAGVAAAAVVFTGGVNLSPSFADSMMQVPVLGSIVRVINFNQFKYDKETYNANMDTPIIEGLENEALQKSLNSKYLEENKKLFAEFEKDVAEMEKFEEGGHLGVDSGYEVKTDNEDILSIARWVVNTVGSSSTTMHYDTIDKKNQIVITLPSLFKDDSYIDVISENILSQMKANMEKDPDKSYWIKGVDDMTDGFEKITKDQQFYINSKGKLVISFDKYEVAAGYMGIVEFEIPTEVIKDILVGNSYIK